VENEVQNPDTYRRRTVENSSSFRIVVKLACHNKMLIGAVTFLTFHSESEKLSTALKESERILGRVSQLVR
jgi:hypothetical protein